MGETEVVFHAHLLRSKELQPQRLFPEGFLTFAQQDLRTYLSESRTIFSGSESQSRSVSHREVVQ